MTITMSLAIAGNLFMIFVIWRGNKTARRRISPVQLLLLHTCAADLLFALCCLGTEIVLILHYPFFPWPEWLCKLIRFTQMVPLYASPFLLVAISADRYQAICRPLAHFRRSRYRRPNCLAFVAWTLALFCSTPQVFIWGKYDKRDECITFYGHGISLIKSIYVIAFNTLAWLLPSLMAGSFYYCVCKAVWLSQNSKPQLDLTNSKLDVCNNAETQSYVERLRTKSCGIRRQTSEFDRKRVQTVRLTLTIIACNFFLWAPFCVVNIVQANAPHLLSLLSRIAQSYLAPSIMAYVMVLGNLNSCVNPWIYILFNRSHVKRAFCFSTKQNLNTYSTCSRATVNGVSEVATESVVYADSKPNGNSQSRNSLEASPPKVLRVSTEKRRSMFYADRLELNLETSSVRSIPRVRSIGAASDERQALLKTNGPQ